MKNLIHILVLISLLVLVSCKGGGGSSSVAANNNSGNNTTSYTIGQNVGGGLYAGNTNGNDLIITPSGCTDHASPTCSGNDFVSKWWSDDATTITNIYDSVDGYNNTDLIINAANAASIQSPAALYCANLVYGGYTNWYLPSKDEMQEIMDNNANNNNVLNFRDEQGNNGGNIAYRYWTSTIKNDDGLNNRPYYFTYDSTYIIGQHGITNYWQRSSMQQYSGVVTLGTTYNYMVRCIRHL